jgi:hypothetical protein
MNLFAWGLSIFLLAIMLTDFIRVERERRNNREKMSEKVFRGPSEAGFASGGAQERNGRPV